MKVSELEGALLDFWVAKALGISGTKVMRSTLAGNGRGHKHEWYEIDYPAYSTDWTQGGPLIEREKLWIQPSFNDLWYAHKTGLGDSKCAQYGPTALIAAMRALVASKFGGEIPEQEQRDE